MTTARGRLPARRVPLSAVAEGERWTCRYCPSCERRRMMPDGERTCLHCQEGARPQVFHLLCLRAVREQAGYTLEELEEQVFIARFTLRRMEEGRAKVRTKRARRIAAALGTTVDALSASTTAAVALRTTVAAKLATRNGKGAA